MLCYMNKINNQLNQSWWINNTFILTFSILDPSQTLTVFEINLNILQILLWLKLCTSNTFNNLRLPLLSNLKLVLEHYHSLKCKSYFIHNVLLTLHLMKKVRKQIILLKKNTHRSSKCLEGVAKMSKIRKSTKQ